MIIEALCKHVHVQGTPNSFTLSYSQSPPLELSAAPTIMGLGIPQTKAARYCISCLFLAGTCNAIRQFITRVSWSA